MITYRQQTWEENEREHAEERSLTASRIAAEPSSAQNIQEENSPFPLDSVVELKWTEYSARFERLHGC